MKALWFRKCASWEEEAEADREYWAQFSADEKVALIEDLKRSWLLISPNATPPNDDPFRYVAELNRARVRAVIVGAYAVAFHAKPRYTDALDVLAESVPSTQFGEAPNRVNIINHINGVTFEEAWDSRVEGKFGNERAFFIGKAELIRNKEAVARLQDLADADLLRRF